MPSKSRRKRGKQSLQGKKRKGKLTPVLKTAEQPVASQTYTSATPAPVTTPSAGAPMPTSTPVIARYPHVSSELKRIGIIAAIMLAVLFILSRVLP